MSMSMNEIRNHVQGRGSPTVGTACLFAALLTALVLGVGGSLDPASADYPYGGQSPERTGCANGAVAARPTRTIRDGRKGQKRREIGKLYFLYSERCGTNWVKVTYDNGLYYPKPSVWHQNQRGTSLYTAWDAPDRGAVWTEMIEGRNITNCGGVQIYESGPLGGPSTKTYVGWYYAGCR